MTPRPSCVRLLPRFRPFQVGGQGGEGFRQAPQGGAVCLGARLFQQSPFRQSPFHQSSGHQNQGGVAELIGGLVHGLKMASWVLPAKFYWGLVFWGKTKTVKSDTIHLKRRHAGGFAGTGKPHGGTAFGGERGEALLWASPRRSGQTCKGLGGADETLADHSSSSILLPFLARPTLGVAMVSVWHRPGRSQRRRSDAPQKNLAGRSLAPRQLHPAGGPG